MATRNDGICANCGELSPVRYGKRCADCYIEALEDWQQRAVPHLRIGALHTAVEGRRREIDAMFAEIE